MLWYRFWLFNNPESVYVVLFGQHRDQTHCFIIVVGPSSTNFFVSFFQSRNLKNYPTPPPCPDQANSAPSFPLLTSGGILLKPSPANSHPPKDFGGFPRTYDFDQGQLPPPPSDREARGIAFDHGVSTYNMLAKQIWMALNSDGSDIFQYFHIQFSDRSK